MDFKTIKDKENQLEFRLDNLSLGEGETIGNFLRRYLLISGKCYKPIAIKVSVDGEVMKTPFLTNTTIDEDVYSIMVKLKDVVYSCETEDKISEEEIVRMNYSGSDEVITCGMLISSDEDVKIREDFKEICLVHNTEGRKLNIEIVLCYNRGYIASYMNKVILEENNFRVEDYHVVGTSYNKIQNISYKIDKESSQHSESLTMSVETLYGSAKNEVVGLITTILTMLTYLRDKL